uniref:G_PROTEIN_RECEP_F1_2 domain-containing protein n=1 Tax=Globodera pallida TaxID=36090 RepID=A0A183C9E4_GLOPA
MENSSQSVAHSITAASSSTHFLKQNKLLALLAVADLCSSLGILTLGLMRKALYERIVETSQVPLETIWSCASKPFVYLRLIGVIVPPWVVLWISSERFMAVLTPQIYCRHIFNRSRFVLPIILLYSVLSLGFVYFIAWSKRNDPVEAYCGRRKIFTKYYSIYTFLVDIFSYSIALAINCATACRLARLQSHLKSRGCIQRQVNRVHYMLIISLFATLTVTVPNALFLSSILFHKWMHFDLTDPSNWMITAKCAANFFIFLLFMEEFRVRIYEILGCISRNPSRERQYEVSALGLAMTNRRRTVSVTKRVKIGIPRGSLAR